MVLLIVMLTAALYLNASAQSEKSNFDKLNVLKSGNSARFDFTGDKSAASVMLISGRDQLKTHISGDYIQSAYELKEERGIKTLYIYLPPKWNYSEISGLSFGKTYRNRSRVQ